MKNWTAGELVILKEMGGWSVPTEYYGSRHGVGSGLVLLSNQMGSVWLLLELGVYCYLNRSAVTKGFWQFCYVLLGVVAAARLFVSVWSLLPCGRIKRMR